MREYQHFFVTWTLILAGGCGGSQSRSDERTEIKSDEAKLNPAGRTKFENTPPPRTPITIATFNINWGNRDIRSTADIIIEANADFVCIQESGSDFENYARTHLRARYPTIMFRGDGNRFPAERFGCLSAHPVRKETFLPAKHGIFGTWIVEVGVAGETIQIANVHLEPVRPADDVLGALSAFGEAEKVHEAEIRRVLEHLAPGLPTVVAGDFNSVSPGAAPKFLVENGFVDSFASVTESADSRPTWRWPTRFLILNGRIDYIIPSRHFNTIESRIADETTSDHSLVVSRFEWAHEVGD
jgi:endonuclease/exonuclease/phosphatase family metal-dependent hydrolase